MPAELPGTSFISTLNSPKRYFSVELNPAPELLSRTSDATCLPEASKSERTSPSVRNSSSQADCAEAGWLKQSASARTTAATARAGGASGARDRRAMAAVGAAGTSVLAISFWKGAWSVGLGFGWVLRRSQPEVARLCSECECDGSRAVVVLAQDAPHKLHAF